MFVCSVTRTSTSLMALTVGALPSQHLLFLWVVMRMRRAQVTCLCSSIVFVAIFFLAMPRSKVCDEVNEGGEGGGWLRALGSTPHGSSMQISFQATSFHHHMCACAVHARVASASEPQARG